MNYFPLEYPSLLWCCSFGDSYIICLTATITQNRSLYLDKVQAEHWKRRPVDWFKQLLQPFYGSLHFCPDWVKLSSGKIHLRYTIDIYMIDGIMQTDISQGLLTGHITLHISQNSSQTFRVLAILLNWQPNKHQYTHHSVSLEALIFSDQLEKTCIRQLMETINRMLHLKKDLRIKLKE